MNQTKTNLEEFDRIVKFADKNAARAMETEGARDVTNEHTIKGIIVELLRNSESMAKLESDVLREAKMQLRFIVSAYPYNQLAESTGADELVRDTMDSVKLDLAQLEENGLDIEAFGYFVERAQDLAQLKKGLGYFIAKLKKDLGYFIERATEFENTIYDGVRSMLLRGWTAAYIKCCEGLLVRQLFNLENPINA